MDEEASLKHNQAVDRMFEVAQERALEVSGSLIGKGRVTPELQEAISLFISRALDREGNPDAAIRLQEATLATIESGIGNRATRAKATRVGRNISLIALRTARRVTLKEEFPER